MKERFKTAEWEKVKHLPILMFHFVSLADHKLQKEEVETFVKELHDAMAYKDPLHRELFFDLSSPAVFAEAFEYVMGPVTDSVAGIEKEFKAIKKALKKRLSTEEYNRFLVSMTGTGLKVADAAGDGPSNVSREEMVALAMFADKFEVDVDAGTAALRNL